MKPLFFVLALCAAAIACKKSDVNVTEPCPIKQTTVAGRYVTTAIKYKASSSAAEQDLFTPLDSCQKDDTFELRRDSSVTILPGRLVCPGPPPPGSLTVWYVSADGKKFTFDAEYDIVSFDCTNLVVTQKDVNVTGDIRTLTLSKE